MVSLESVRASNEKLKNLPPGLVALFGISMFAVVVLKHSKLSI